MALNLARNSRMFFTTNVNATTGVVTEGSHTTSTTYEIQVLDGFSFSQTTNTETVTINEAGSTPTRGQRSFNTSLAPVDFSFSTYLRPHKPSTVVTAEEAPLWNVLVTGASAGTPGWSESASKADIVLTYSNANQLKKFGLIFVIDGVTYVIDNCAMNQVTIDFGLDSIATATWSGNGTAIRRMATSTTTPTAGTFTGTITGAYQQKYTAPGFIANKLSTCTIGSYSVPLTGGSFTLNNNVTFLTPANLGVVNTPTTYFTGTRSITGTVNAYLRTGDATDTGSLLAAMLAATDSTSPNYAVTINIGGTSGQRIVLSMPTSVITIPSIDVQQVVSTAINFTAQGSTTGLANAPYSIEANNEFTGQYYSS